VFLKFVEQIGELKWLRKQPSGAKAQSVCGLYGTTEVVPCYKAFEFCGRAEFFRSL